MQFLSINTNTTLSELADLVGQRNVESVLVANNLKRTPAIGRAFKAACGAATLGVVGAVSAQRKMTLLNTVAGYADIFETVSLLDDAGWKLFSATGAIPNMLKIPESISLPPAVGVLGGVPLGISNIIYKKVIDCLKRDKEIDPAIFNEYESNKPSQIVDEKDNHSSDVFQWASIPWGQITLYSSLGGDSKDFPVYPEELGDGRNANYTQMPDMLYQYEPWQVYQSSGPRSNTFTFHFHRDMWTGDHKDGKANELIRFCEANCYPEYNGSAVNTATVTLYIAGKPFITGVMTGVSTKWSGPIGHDGFYLECELELTIVEVSAVKLDYKSVRSKGLIG